jgi:anti-sigma factor RsiW
MSRMPVTEADLHAYVDGVLPEARRDEVEAHLAARSEDARRVQEWREQNKALHLWFDPVLDEPLPAGVQVPLRARGMRPPIRYAAAVALFALGGVSGWYLHAFSSAKSTDAVGFARQAAIAHVVYSPEVRHPVEVGADEEAHLVRWLSKRLGASLKVPHLGGVGYQLVGGRLLPGNQGPVAQFMYQDANGQRLTLYVRNASADNRETAFRFTQERGVSVFYWLDRKFGYALSGEIDKTDLLRVAQLVYQQFNP